jgi:Leucine-rich repeat (LRR) protein
MIQNYEIITNLYNETIVNSTFDDVYIENFIKNLKIIELNNWGIEILSKNAFEKFSKLKVLRLNSNSINTIDFLSFLTNDTSYNENGIEYYKNQLIELDLSNNKIELIKIENLMYFENLKILNLSRNHIRVIDLKLISLIAPHLQVFDVSFNYIQKFSLLNVNNRGGMQTSATSYFYSIQLIYNYFLKDLIYINLSGNYISNILDLFSVTSNQLESSQEYEK